ncbi:hypothetical protein PM082_005020 [Marasmius tenuissimus]|nr:hypothetical protein PM082_005020 [Marasmius tenuissimus]
MSQEKPGDHSRSQSPLSRSYEEPKYTTVDEHGTQTRHRNTSQPSEYLEEARTLLDHERRHGRNQSMSSVYQDHRLSFQLPAHERHMSTTSFQTFDSSATLNARPKLSKAAGKRASVERFLRKGRKNVGVLASLRAIALSSWLNVFIIFIPLSWFAHFYNKKHHKESEDETIKFDLPYAVTFVFSLLAIMPMQKFFDFGGEQMAFYVGKDLGDLIVVTLNNAVEATLAVILLIKCEIKLLQSTIAGVILLHLLLVPGTAFIIDGARLLHQDLHPQITQLNHTLLIMGVLSLLLPAAFFSVIDHGDNGHAINDETRQTFLTMSRGLAIILLIVYICSRFYLHNPPGEQHDIEVPTSLRDEEEYLLTAEPLVNQWVCLAALAVTLGLMAGTAVWLVESIEVVREEGKIPEEWFGLILLPFVSFSADGAVALGYFVRYVIQSIRGRDKPPATLARARAIDLSIQFILFWMPLIVLLGWWTNRPLPLLFDFFEIAVLIGSCFLVNYVTQDGKTNWAEGVAMVAFYAMIVLCAWFYGGQADVALLLQFGTCNHEAAGAGHGSGGGSGGGGGGGEH